MKTLILSLLLSVVFTSSVRAQDSTRLQRYGYVIGASLTFALVDFLGWNLDIVQHPNNSKPLFRAIMIATQVAISYFLYKTCGLTSAIAFNLIWWTWGDDLAFYGYQEALNLPAPWPNRAAVSNLEDNHITWAGWTPIGLLRPRGSVIDRSALYYQAFVGFSISMALLW